MWDLPEVHTRLHRIMSKAFHAVQGIMRQNEVDMCTAAYILALRRLGEAAEAQGTESYFQEKA